MRFEAEVISHAGNRFPLTVHAPSERVARKKFDTICRNSQLGCVSIIEKPYTEEEIHELVSKGR